MLQKYTEKFNELYLVKKMIKKYGPEATLSSILSEYETACKKMKCDNCDDFDYTYHGVCGIEGATKLLKKML